MSHINQLNKTMKQQETISIFLSKQLEILENENRIGTLHFNNKLSVEEAKQIILALATENWDNNNK